MKNYPLSIQIWIVIAIITLSITLLLSIILPNTLREFFTKETYATIDSAQDLVFNQFSGDIYRDYIGPGFFGENKQIFENARTVNHLILYNDNRVTSNTPIPMAFIDKLIDEAINQKNTSQEYITETDQGKIFYIITKGKALGKDAYLISYLGDSYRRDLVETLFKKLITVMILILLFSWIPSLLLSRYLTRPLVDLEKRVNRLANNEWSEPINLKREDEIGKLGISIEHLRNQLIRQDEAEQSFLQHVSHELKTPVMVIRSFSQAIKDGIYPKGDLDCSIDIIDKEGERLENKIKNLLYLTKLNYLSNHEVSKENISLDLLIREVLERFSWRRSDINWDIDLMPIYIDGDLEQWRIVIENLLDNQIRYAKSNIHISLKGIKGKAVLRISNDGPPIEDSIINNISGKFNKGNKGEFGLGLAIVSKILNGHNASMNVVNEKDGVSFNIEI